MARRREDRSRLPVGYFNELESRSSESLHQTRPYGSGKKDGAAFEGWIQPTATWRRLLGNTQNHMEKLNRAWQVDWNKDQWKKWWMNLWQAEILLQDKMWIWRLIHGGLCVGERLRKMSITNGICQRCEKSIETIEHCVMTCDEVKGRWQRVRFLLRCAQPDRVPNLNLISSLEWAVQNKQLRISFLLLTVSLTKRFWKERCNFHFEGKIQRVPVRMMVNEVMNTGKEMEATTFNVEKKQRTEVAKKQRIEVAVAYLCLMKDREGIEAGKDSYNLRRMLGPSRTSRSTSQETESIVSKNTNSQAAEGQEDSERVNTENSEQVEGRSDLHLAEDLMMLGFVETTGQVGHL
ncbi:hypothetical protein R1sor_016191 [Riccia sorocarpa]|uniref:Reverse transcriptase zinc-binding domain-containing protein n=1 Tax=Riccia sorocarpa TaxID=122646 RepID=A0ABD3HEB4_9MARC